MKHKSGSDIVMRISLSTSVKVREHLVCREHFLIVMSNEKWPIFGRQNILDIFGQHFWLALDSRLDISWEMSESYITSMHALVR